MKGIANSIAIFVILIIVFCMGRCDRQRQLIDSEPKIIRDTIRITDTIQLPAPPPVIITKIRTDTIYIDSARLFAQNDIQILSDTLCNIEAVAIPIKQAIYETDDYRAVISGYNPSLDSMTIYRQTQYIRQVEIHNRNKRWGVGVQVGIGATRQGLSPYLGIGLHYSLFNF